MRDENQVRERYELTIERIRTIPNEESVRQIYREFFQKTAVFLLELNTILNRVCCGGKISTLEELRRENTNIYRDILEENYEKSYANPEYAVATLGEEAGKLLGFLYAELRRGIVFAYEENIDYLTVHNELFIEIYNCFENESEPNWKEIKSILYWYVSDYYDVFVTDRIEVSFTETECRAMEILENADLSDVSYLYQYGEYISEKEEELAASWCEMPDELVQEKAQNAASALVEAMKSSGNSLLKGRIVSISYCLGMERFVRGTVQKLREYGLKVTVAGKARGAFLEDGPFAEGYFEATRQQFDADHSSDIALVWDKKMMERKLEVLRTSLEQMKDMAEKYAGVICFSKDEEVKTTPAAAAITFSEKQLALKEIYLEKEKQIINQYSKFNKYLLQEVNTGMVDILLQD